MVKPLGSTGPTVQGQKLTRAENFRQSQRLAAGFFLGPASHSYWAYLSSLIFIILTRFSSEVAVTATLATSGVFLAVWCGIKGLSVRVYHFEQVWGVKQLQLRFRLSIVNPCLGKQSLPIPLPTPFSGHLAVGHGPGQQPYISTRGVLSCLLCFNPS